MDIYGFEEVSFVGRIAYGIMCAEEYLTQQYPCKNWILVFESFWKITNLDLWDNWMDEVIVMNLVTFTGLSFETANTNNYVYVTGLLITKTFNVNHLREIRSCFSYCDRTSYHEEQKVWEQICQV